MTPAGAVVRRETLRAQLADALRDEILAGRLAAGQHITVGEIAEQYGVSATPVREALVDLAAQGLLDVEQHRGYRVHAFTLDDFRAMIEARALVVQGLFRPPGPPPLVAPAGTAALTAMRRRAEEAERAATAGDLDVLVHYDLRFWREIGALVGNSYISAFLERVRLHCWVFAVPYLRHESDLLGTFWQGHLGLVDAIERRDAARAEEVMGASDHHSLMLIERLAGS